MAIMELGATGNTNAASALCSTLPLGPVFNSVSDDVKIGLNGPGADPIDIRYSKIFLYPEI